MLRILQFIAAEVKTLPRFIFLITLGLASLDASDRVDVCFSHGYQGGKAYCTDMASQLANLIAKAERRILMAIYMITDAKIAKAVIDAKKIKPSLDIRIIVDATSVEYAGGKAITLAENGIDVYVFNFDKLRACKQSHSLNKPVKPAKKPLLKKNKLIAGSFKFGKNLPKPKAAIMHNKYVIVDDIFWSGSFNFTIRANCANQENAVIVENALVTAKASENFEHLMLHVDALETSKITVEKAKSESFDDKTKLDSKNREKEQPWFKKRKYKKRWLEEYDIFFDNDDDESYFALAKRWCTEVLTDIWGTVQKVFA